MKDKIVDRRDCLKNAGAAILAGAAPLGSSASARTTGRTDYFAGNGFGEGVAIVQHPAGEHLDGKTYVSYQGPLEDPYVAVYDHAAQTWDGPYQAGVSQLGKGPEFADRIDSHGKPTLLIDAQGYIHIFYGGHGGSRDNGLKNTLGGAHLGDNRHAVSRRPYDISEWEDLNNISPFGTYNQAIKMDNGDIYLFYRHGAHRSDWVFQKSTDNGRTFDPPVSFLTHLRRDDVEATDSWYPYLRRGRGSEIIVSFDYHICRDSWPGRGHQGERHNLYYMTFDTADGSWRNIHGEDLPIPVNRETADAKARIFESDDIWTFNQSLTLDDQGHPHIGIAMGIDTGARHGGPKAMRHFRWTGRNWVGGVNRGLPDSRGDLEAHSSDHVRFLLSWTDRSDSVRVGRILWAESRDGGANFVPERVLLERRGKAFSISSFIHNAHPDARVIVAESAPRGSKMRPVYLVGDKGPIGRDDLL